MFRNYLKTALRNLRKNKLYSAINIFGLMVALAACLLIGLFIIHELSYDKFNKNGNRIVRATMAYNRSGTLSETASTGTKPGPEFKRLFPEVAEYARTYIGSRVIKGNDKLFEENRILFADPAFFNMFSFPLIEGTSGGVLDRDDKIAISLSMARKYFGESAAINKTLTLGTKDYTVAGVFADVPQNSQLKFDFVTQFLNVNKNVQTEQWWTANWVTYFMLKSPTDIATFQKHIDGHMNSAPVRKEAGLEGTDFLRYVLEPLQSVHLHSKLAGFEPNGNMRYIIMFAIIAGLILIIACANYTNLATAQSAGRSGEIGMRKVMGATRKQVFFQFIGESSAITFIAAVFGLVLSILLIPQFNLITGKHFTTSDVLQPLPVLLLVSFSVLVSFLAGAYPALVLSGTGIMGVLKSGFNFTGSSNVLRKGLIVVQFSISVFLIVYTGIILQQMNFLQSKNLGYDKEHVMVLPIDGRMAENFEITKDAIAGIPGVEGVTAAYETPEFVEWGDGITATDEKGLHEVSLNAMPVDLDFSKTLKMQMIAGRDFQQGDFALMDTNNNGANFRQPYIINEALAKKLGWTPEQSIGRIVDKGSPGPVVGVVKDFNFESLHEQVKPLLLFLSRDMARTFMVRLGKGDLKESIAKVAAVWKERVPHRPFEYHFLDEDYNKLYESEQRTSSLFFVTAVLAIVLGCLGLFGLTVFTVVQRMKEIGIRRILGANIGSIVLLIAKNFLILVAVSIAIALPLAWLAGKKWLEDFAFRINISSWLFVGTAVAVLGIVLFTVSFQAIRGAMMNPVKSLRAE